MGKIAFVFSGQGAQYPGMGRELADISAYAKAVFDMADGLRPNTSRQCWEGSREELGRTIVTQPCLFCADLAAAEALREQGISADMCAGFSLGEIPALAFSGLLTGEQAFRLVCRRAELMDACAEANPGAMAAILGLDAGIIEEVCQRAGVWAVNYNSDKQTVIAGGTEQIAAACEELKSKGGKAVPLAVSGAFHSPFMAAASAGMAEYLKDVSFARPIIPLYANVTAQPYGEDPASLVAGQISSPVRWRESVENMLAAGADIFIEVGTGKTLANLIRRMAPEAVILNVEDKATLELAVARIMEVRNA